VNHLERTKRTRDKLKIRLGVLKEKKKELLPLLERHKCKTPRDIKKAIATLKKKRDSLNKQITQLSDDCSSIKEKIEEKLDA